MPLLLKDDLGIFKEDIFEPIFQRTLGLEGGFTVDEGGKTNFGITQTLLNNFNKQKELPEEDVTKIGTEKAREIYEEEFFKRPKYDKLPPNVASLQFDYGVQSSPNRATKSLQKIIGAEVDGVVGPKTIKATEDFIKVQGEKPLMQKLINDRVDFLKTTPAYKTKSKGLMNRIKKIKDEFDLSKLNPFAVSEAQAAGLELTDDLGIFEEKAAPKLQDDLGIFKEAPKGAELRALPEDTVLRDLKPEEREADFDFSVSNMADKLFTKTTGLTPKQGILGKKKLGQVFGRTFQAMMAITGAPILALGYEALNQAKNAIVTATKKEKFDPLEIRMLSEIIPDEAGQVVKIGSTVAENLVDIALIGGLYRSATVGTLKSTIKELGLKLEKAGYGTGKKTINMDAIKEVAKGTTLENQAAQWLKVKQAQIRPKDVIGGVPPAPTPGVPAVQPVPPVRAGVQPQFNNPNDPKMLDFLARYIDPKKVASMTPQMRLAAGNMTAEELRDLSNELKIFEPTAIEPEKLPEKPVTAKVEDAVAEPEKPEVVPPVEIPQGKQGIVEYNTKEEAEDHITDPERYQAVLIGDTGKWEVHPKGGTRVGGVKIDLKAKPKLFTEHPLVKSVLTPEKKTELSKMSGEELKDVLNQPVSKAIKDEAKRLLAETPAKKEVSVPPKKPALIKPKELTKSQDDIIDEASDYVVRVTKTQGRLLDFADMWKGYQSTHQTNALTQKGFNEVYRAVEIKVKPAPVKETRPKATYKIKVGQEWQIPQSQKKISVPGGEIGAVKLIGPAKKKITSEKYMQLIQSSLTDVEVTQEGDFMVIKGYPKKVLDPATEKKIKVYGSSAGGAVSASPASATTGYGEVSPKEVKERPVKSNLKKVDETLPPISRTKFAVDEILKLVSPGHRAGAARPTARILRSRLAEEARNRVLAANQLNESSNAFLFMSKNDVYEYIHNLETGQPQKTEKLTLYAEQMRRLLDEARLDIQSLGKGQLENYYENYFPHVWKDPKKAEAAIMRIFSKKKLEGSKSFLKKRTIMTVKEGQAAGLELVSDNPVDIVLLKLHEMGRYAMAQRTIQDMKSQGLVKFVYSRSMPPEGYQRINDNLFTVYMPPEITKKEAYDSLLVDQLMDISKSLNIDTKRFESLGRRRAWGLAYEEAPPERVRTKAFGPESVLIHEIGHVLGFRYHLYDMLGRRKEGKWTTYKKGKNVGEAKFVHDKEAVEHRRKIDEQWRALADARFKSKKVTPAFENYVRKAAEKEAVLLEAYLHAPNEFQRAAPDLFKLFKEFLNKHTELRPLLDVQPSLVLGESAVKIKIPGFTVLGHYYAPEPAARILNNYLSPGLRGSDYKAISAPFNATRMVANLINMAQLALSGFHAFNVSTDMMASTLGQGIRNLTTRGQRLKGIGQITQAPIAPLIRMWDGTRLRQAYNQQLTTIKNPKLRELVESLILAGGRDRMDKFYYNQGMKALQLTVSQIYKGSAFEKVAGMMKLPLDLFTSTLEGLAYPIMGWYVPTGKLGIFSMMADHELQRFKGGEINEEQLWERLTSSWDSTDNRMGMLVYDNLFWNKTLKDASMLAVRSVGWNLGSWREFPGSIVDVVTTGERLERGDKVISQKMAYVGSAVMLYAAMGASIMYLMTGEGPEEAKDYFFPKTGNKNPDGSAERLSLPTYAKDWYSWSQRPAQTARNKLHPIWTAMSELARNKDFFNVLVRNSEDPIEQQVVDFVKHGAKNFKPFSLRNYEKMQKVSPWEKTKNALVSITGISSAPAYITRSNAQKLAYRYIIERIPDKPITKEEFEVRMYKKAVKDGMRKATLPMGEYEKAKRILGPKIIRKMEKEVQNTPFSVLFNRLSFKESINVYAISNEQEKKESRQLLIKKYNKYKNDRRTTPEMKSLYWELLKPIPQEKKKPGLRPRTQ